jgi:polysaccharide export outer membrane protein
MLKFLSVNSFLFLCILALTTVSCKTEKNYTYFQTRPDNSQLKTLITKDFEHKVRPDDILLININTADRVTSPLYNTSPLGYLVDKRGTIQLYKIGEVNVQGLTLYQLKEKLYKLFQPYLVDPVIDAAFKNHKIIVMGEVGLPGVISMETEHLSLLEALAARGDLKESARRDRILVIRNTPDGKIFNRMNLLDESIFNSPFYYLQADDIVYVEPDPEKKKSTNTQQVVGYILSGASLLFLILDRIR